MENCNFSHITRFVSALSGKKHIGLYLSALFVAFILPAALLLHTTGSYYITSENDFFSSYVPHAETFLNGNFVIDVYRGPLYIFFLAGIKSLTGNYLTAGIIISSLSAGTFLYFTYSLLSFIFTKKAAFTAVILTAINPFFMVYSYAPGTDMLFIALCAISVRSFLSDNKNRNVKIALSGLFASLAFLTRYNAVFLLSIPLIILFVKGLFPVIKTRVKTAFIFIVVFLVTAAPWGIYTFTVKGEPFYNENYRNIAISLGTKEDINWETEWNRNSKKYDSVTDIIAKEPDKLAETLTANLLFHSYKSFATLNSFYTGIFALMGLIFIRMRKVTVGQLAYGLICISFFVLLLPVFYDSRFFLFLLPLFSVLACMGVNRISGYSGRSRGIIYAALFCFGLVASVSYNSHIIGGQQEIKNMGKVFMSSGLPYSKGMIVSSRMPHISYELNLNWKVLPAGKSLNNTLKELAKKGVDYIYFSRREFNERKPLRSLIDPLNAPPGLEPVVYLDEDRAVLYKINSSLLQK